MARALTSSGLRGILARHSKARGLPEGRTTLSTLAMTQARFELLARALFWLALVGAVALALMPQPPTLPTDAFGDKFNHMLAFATLAALASMGWPRMERLRVAERLSFLGALIEVSQSIPGINRDCDIRDWIADTLAILVVIGIAALVARRSPRREAQGSGL
jgi:VanZ family protein